MEIKSIKIKDLKFHPSNPRRIKKDQMEKLCRSIEADPEFLNCRPVLVNSFDDQLVIYAGNQRVRAAKKLGMKEIPCIVDIDLHEDVMKKRMIIDNKTYGEFDFDVLANEYEIDFLIECGFNAEELIGKCGEETETQNDEEEQIEIPDEPKTQDGDLYELGHHRLICGDMKNPKLLELLLSKTKIDMVYTDPPYGINEKTDRQFTSKSRKCSGNKFSKIIGDTTTDAASEGYKICNALDVNIMIFWGANFYAHSLPESGNWLVWDKRVEDKQQDFNSDCELAWVKSNSPSVRIFRHLWKGMIKASEHGQARIHPTQKPIALAIWCFETYGEKAKNVLDLFGGSGSTLIACEKSNKNCFMMEIEPAYCDIIVERWCKLTGKKAKRNGVEIDQL